jgi:hypothetical protein
MWFYLEFALICVGIFYSYRLGYQNGANTAMKAIRYSLEKAKQEQAIKDLRPPQ